MSPLTIMMLFIGTPFSSKTQTSMLSLRTIRSRKQLLEKKHTGVGANATCVADVF